MTGELADMPASSVNASRPKRPHRRESTGHICTACDQCYRCKVKCSGEKPICERCRTNKSACTYSTGKPLGKPKGSKNKVQRSKIALACVDTSKPAAAFQPSGTRLVSGTKRSNSTELPPAKRRVSIATASGEPSVAFNHLASPIDETSELHLDPALATSISPQQALSAVDEALPFQFDDSQHDHPVPQQNQPSHTEDFFQDPKLDFDDFNWLSNPDTMVSSMPSPPPAEITSPDLTSHEQTSSAEHHPIALPGRNPLETSPLPVSFHPSHLPCLCDPLALNIISELQFLQTALSPLDTALILARRGFSTVSSSLSCPSCLSSSRSLFYACILIIQQVFTCYGTVKLQGPKMLGYKPMENSKPQHSVVSIGDFEVEDEEGCNSILDAIVRAEMERGKGVIGGLERWAEKTGDGSQKMAGLLLRSLREEVGC